MNSPSASPNEIIATETGPIKAAVILAALRAAGWEVVLTAEEASRRALADLHKLVPPLTAEEKAQQDAFDKPYYLSM